MNEVDSFNIASLFELPQPIPWIESIYAFDIDLMFTREIDKHKYDDYDLAWLFPVVQIEVDAGSWIECLDSFDIDTMFALDVEGHKYDYCFLEWLFITPVEEVEEVEEAPYADCDLSWLFGTGTEPNISEVEVCNYYNIAWLFKEIATPWMDEVDDFGIASLFELPETEIKIIESKTLENTISEVTNTTSTHCDSTTGNNTDKEDDKIDGATFDLFNKVFGYETAAEIEPIVKGEESDGGEIDEMAFEMFSDCFGKESNANVVPVIEKLDTIFKVCNFITSVYVQTIQCLIML